jgi:hypothetical protein
VPAPSVLTCDNKDSAWKLFGGYRFNPNFALEASVAAVGTLEIAPQFSIFGKAGFLMTDQETRGASARKRDDTELHYGIGARLAVAPNWAARAEWEKTEKLKVELLSLGAEYRF